MHWLATGQTFGKRCHRQSARSRVFRAGWLVNDGRRSHCLIRDISPQGAQIRMSALVPDSCYLIDLKNGSAHHARPVWRNGTLSGLRLDETHALNALPAHLEYLNATS
jgi:hypothetical protein